MRYNSWNEFSSSADATDLNFVFILCDSIQNEVFMVWPGLPMKVHWGMSDPAAVEGSHTEKMVAYNDAIRMPNNWIGIFVSLPMESIDRLSLQIKLHEIGSTENIASSGPVLRQAMFKVIS